MLLLLMVGEYRRLGVIGPPGVRRLGAGAAGWGGHLPGCVRPRGGWLGLMPARPVVGLTLESVELETEDSVPEFVRELVVRGNVGRRLIQAAPGGASRTMLLEATPE